MTITRREALALCAAPALARGRPAVAVTIDDAAWNAIPENRRDEADTRLLDSLAGTRAFLFPIGRNVDNPRGAAILNRWNSAGHRIANHTYSHLRLTGATAPEAFEADVLRADDLLRTYSGFRKYFRFPALKEGETRPVRDRLRAFLARHGYRNGAVTIDASDWFYNQRLLARIRAGGGFDESRFRQPYLDHIRDRAQYYDRLSREVLGYTVPHVLLLHYNLLNALFLGDLLDMFRSRGWAILDAEEAFAHPIYRRLPDTAPAGESLLWALAKASGRFEGRLRYPAEDSTYERPLLDKLGL